MSSGFIEGLGILVINAGSSSFKYQVLDMRSEQGLCQGLVERIGSRDSVLKHKRYPGTDREQSYTYPGEYATHAAGMKAMFKIMFDRELGGVLDSEKAIGAVGHRVLLAGPGYSEVLVDEHIKQVIREYGPLGPLHNPANLAGIDVIEELFPELPNVAVFDTGFHSTLPEEAYTYAIPVDLAEKHKIRRYGYHGTSHRYVRRVAAGLLKMSTTQANLITCHLGNGCSICAIGGGKSLDTSMGLTPLEGLVMGTRSGSIDPAIVTYLAEQEGFTATELNALFNKKSGLLGLCGKSDMRDILEARQNGDVRADLAFKVFVYSIRKHIGMYYPVLGRVDGIVFTGGIGENSAQVRSAVCKDMGVLGISLNEVLNSQQSSEARIISSGKTKTKVMVVPTNEELEIARATVRVIASRYV